VPAGIYHATNSGAVSWCEFALKIQELSGMDQVLIAGVKSEGWPAKAKRPSFSVLSNSKLELLGLNSMSNWEQALEIEMPYLIGIQNRTQMP
jgi:dTDP-4-dehydrorhamnose reductase